METTVVQQGPQVLDYVLTAAVPILGTVISLIGLKIKEYFDKKLEELHLGGLAQDVDAIVIAAYDQYEIGIKKAKADDGVISQVEFKAACNSAFSKAMEIGREKIKKLPKHLWPIAEAKLVGFIEKSVGTNKAVRAMAKAVNPTQRMDSK